jgi:hypothetical protein
MGLADQTFLRPACLRSLFSRLGCQAGVLQRNLLKQGHYDAIHVRAGGSELGLKGAKEKVKAVKHHDGYATEIPQYWVDAFRVSDGSRGLE